MPKIVKGPASQTVTVCSDCGAKTAAPTGTVGNMRCSGCGKVSRVRR